MAAVFIRPSHPALTLGYFTSPPSPISSTPVSPSAKRTTSASTLSTPTYSKTPFRAIPKPQRPKVNYALLRSHHVIAIKYMISKIRWEQAHNGYIPGESAWREHNFMVQKLEDELKQVEAAQKQLDKFPDFCFAPIISLDSLNKTYGPKTKSQVLKQKEDDEKKDAQLEKEIDKQFPFIKQLFIGPMTKQQARNNKLLRENLKQGDIIDLTVLLPSENLRLVMGEAKKVEKRRPYHEVRMEREREKIRIILEQESARLAKLPDAAEEKTPTARIGPWTEEEFLSTLPVFGPKTKQEALLPVQREQRHIILNFLRKPWPQYDGEAAPLMEKMGRLAIRRLSMDVKGRENKDDKEKKDAKETKETKENK